MPFYFFLKCTRFSVDIYNFCTVGNGNKYFIEAYYNAAHSLLGKTRLTGENGKGTMGCGSGLARGCEEK